jgi:hypothetical protein
MRVKQEHLHRRRRRDELVDIRFHRFDHVHVEGNDDNDDVLRNSRAPVQTYVTSQIRHSNCRFSVKYHSLPIKEQELSEKKAHSSLASAVAGR